jgi:hypothetical protein
MLEFKDDISLDYDLEVDVPGRKIDTSFMGYIDGQLSAVRIQTDQLLKTLPRYSDAQNCCPDDIVRAKLLGTRDYFRQYFHEHLRHISPTREILKHLKKSHQFITSNDVAPDSLLKDPFIQEKLANLNGKKNREHVVLHARGTSEVLWKGGFLYPIVHELMEGSPADAIDYFNEISLIERDARHHVNLMDRVFVRHAVEVLTKKADRRLSKVKRLRA